MSFIYTRTSDAFLYHYTSAAKAAAILKSRALKFGSFARTNDPMEYRRWGFGLVSSRPNRLTFAENNEISKKLSESIKDAARLACFCSDQAPLSGDHTKDILLRGFARPRMWAQYARSHTGACLVFDKARLIAQVAKSLPSARMLSGAVGYQNRPSFPDVFSGPFSVNVDELDSIGVHQFAERFLARNYRALLFEKLLDWRDEAEWRLVIYGAPDGDCFVPLEDSLVGVVHGEATSLMASSRLINLSDRPEIEHIGLCWNNHAPWYDFRRRVWGYSDRKILGRIRDRNRRKSRLKPGEVPVA